MTRVALALLCLGLFADLALADGNIVEGEKVFEDRCAFCHSIADKINKNGPYLVGIVGRPAATAQGYEYSDAMKAFGATGAVWDEARLDLYLKGPLELVKGSKMLTTPVWSDSERADLIAFIKSKM